MGMAVVESGGKLLVESSGGVGERYLMAMDLMSLGRQ